MVKQKYLVQNSPMVTTFTNVTHLFIKVSITSIKETPLVGVNPTVKLAHTPQSHTLEDIDILIPFLINFSFPST